MSVCRAVASWTRLALPRLQIQAAVDSRPHLRFGQNALFKSWVPIRAYAGAHAISASDLIPYEVKDGFLFKEGRRVFSRAEVAIHDRVTDGWIIIDDKVYNVTTWIPYHPGGEKVLAAVLGQDATYEFKGVQHSHQARAQLEKLWIGFIKEKKRFTANEPLDWPIEFGEEGGFH